VNSLSSSTLDLIYVPLFYLGHITRDTVPVMLVTFLVPYLSYSIHCVI
jgi:hypothetical protein